MRAYLSSYRLGNQFEQFLEILPRNPRALLVANALDVFSDEARSRHRAEVYDPYQELEKLGCSVANLDLREYFQSQSSLRSRLAEIDLVWVLGGNSFVLRRAMHLSGFDNLISECVKADEIAYGGFSAGAVIAAPTLEGIQLIDDPEIAPEGYPNEVIWDGLGWTNFVIIPHWQSDHPEATAAEVARDYLQKKGLPYETLSDGQAFLMTGDEMSLLS